MSVCTEFIEKTRRSAGLILACRGIFVLARASSSFGRKFTLSRSYGVIVNFCENSQLC